MSSRKLVTRRARSLRVMLGGTMAFSGLLIGVCVALVCPSRWTMKDYADEMSVSELLQTGIGENSLVKLTGVRLSSSPAPVTIFGNDVPFALDKHGRVVVQVSDPDMRKELIAELRSEGALVGHVSRDEIVHVVRDAINKYEIDVTAIPPLQNLQEVPPQDSYPFVLRPVDTQSQAFQNRYSMLAKVLGGCLGATSLGLVMAGSGGAGWLAWLLYPIPALFSLPGFLLRYGRGTPAIRMMYFLAGVSMIGGAYWLTLCDGRIYSPQTNPLYPSIGFVLASFGVAAVLGAILNQIRGGKLATKENFSEQLAGISSVSSASDLAAAQIQNAAANAGQPVAGLRVETPVVRYHDPQIIVATDDNIPESMALMATGFEALDFEAALVLELGDTENPERQTIQVGCREMVLCIHAWTNDGIEGSERTLRTRLFSVLQNGAVVTTLSQHTPSNAQERIHGGSVVWVANTSDPAKLLSAHLDRTVKAAESLGTSLCGLHTAEWRDVYAYCHRVMTDVGHQFGDNPYKIYPSSHGRFRFPTQPVDSMESMPVS